MGENILTGRIIDAGIAVRMDLKNRPEIITAVKKLQKSVGYEGIVCTKCATIIGPDTDPSHVANWCAGKGECKILIFEDPQKVKVTQLGKV